MDERYRVVRFGAVTRGRRRRARARHAEGRAARADHSCERLVFSGLAAQAGKSVAMLLLAIGVAAAMLYAVKKYLPKIAPSMATGKRLQLIEVLRLTPKTTLFLVQFDGATLLLGQQGESINVIEARSQIPEAVTTPQSE